MTAATALAEAKNVERLKLVRCKNLSDIGIGCIAVGCRKLRLLNLRWCLGVGDLGVGLITVKCKEMRSLDLSYVPVTNKCLSPIFELQYLEDLVLEGCYCIDDDSFVSLKRKCNSLMTLDLSSCQNVSHIGLSSLTASAGCLPELILAYGSPITLPVSDSLQNLSMLKFIRLGGCQVSCSGLKAIGSCIVSILMNLTLLTPKLTRHAGLKSISMCTNPSSLKLGICLNLTDQGLIHVGMNCSNLKELDLYRSTGITDQGISAISHGCASLEVINIAYCRAAVAVGCKQLSKLDIKKCHSIGDTGMIPLTRFSQNLKQINLSYTSVTDVGLLSLASIGRLQNITVLHLKGLTPSGLGAALFACGGLIKIKLQTLFKSLLPQTLFEHLEARGCVFQWRESISGDVDPKLWKHQLDNLD
ncbi:hypothetical protein K7X08_000381 [Anisodus acutangulus]|uniref:Uncharacterized protein n=1 Tax=Anisodus acutangulus TaxID=402998 RepID=A0A9Q1M6M0_9SOLA|nr:hypothetical protein K7X08_000381 [Anisodus acutangulus]